MFSHSKLQRAVLTALRYSSLFTYPLTAREIKYWLPTLASLETVKAQLSTLLRANIIKKEGPFYYLSTQTNLVALRRHRQQTARKKWLIARATARRLALIPWVEEVAVTGSLAMNNCDPDADIDLMIICQPNTLWLSRILVWLLVFPHRRSPLANHPRKIRDKICDNVYLESTHLNLSPSGRLLTVRSFYLAHEVLQAKPVFERHRSHTLFLAQNRWVSSIFPSAWPPSLCSLTISPHSTRSLSTIFYLPNLFSFITQYLFMRAKITRESVSLHHAFFHPRLPSAMSRFRSPHGSIAIGLPVG